MKRSSVEESFEEGLLEHSHYTRPKLFEGEAIPDILLSGDHEAIRRHKRAEAEELTRNRRPDLWHARMTGKAGRIDFAAGQGYDPAHAQGQTS